VRFPNHPTALACHLQFDLKWFQAATFGLIVSLLALSSTDAGADPKRFPLGDIPLPDAVYQRYLKAPPFMDQSTSSLELALPASYDARDEGIVTPAKNQGSCGSCWAFATVGAMESHLLKALGVGPENLSEQQQVSCNTANFGCDGGYSTAVRYWEAPPQPDKGALDESVSPYSASDTTACYEPSGEQMPYRITNFHTLPADTLSFKTSLIEDGPSYWRYTVYSDFYTFWGSYNPGAVYINAGGTYEGGHAVLLIGWDDAKGAFLVKNSWGTGGPNGDGTFWIAYDGHLNNLGFGMVNFDVVAIATCSSHADCDDGVYCNGAEMCGAGGTCEAGTPVSCADDGLFCNGSEQCSEAAMACISVNPPCGLDEQCIEDGQYCALLSCGNGVCEIGEDCSTCPSDCISGPGGGTEQACFKGVADGSCRPNKEDASCIDCSPGYCCGDGVCTVGAEDSFNCALDCGSEPIAEICDNGLDDDGDGATDCADSDCSTFSGCLEPPPQDCGLKKDTCSTGSDCCSGRCNTNQGVCL
jgi:hypothetical protein